MTTCDAPCDVKIGIMTTLGFQSSLHGFLSRPGLWEQFNLIPFYQNFSLLPVCWLFLQNTLGWPYFMSDDYCRTDGTQNPTKKHWFPDLKIEAHTRGLLPATNWTEHKTHDLASRIWSLLQCRKSLQNSHIKPKSRENLFIHNTHINCKFVFKFCTEHDSICAKFRNDWSYDR